ncbi:protein kinase domain-containing protein [Streptomyces sp. G45]|uniref:protein kinase domain-containing protein n=1 Tax=Streptomyces sp. G45 TaxID=3406627 RepID=UPI003C233D50
MAGATGVTRATAGDVGGYRLVAELGAGGMGRVHLARSAAGRPVAVKTVHAHLAAEPEFRERFRRETAAARAVTGPFTAAVLDADPEAERPWLATEFCAGPDLADAVAAHGPLSAADLAALGAALAEALGAVHAAGLVHRDLKPANVVVTRAGPKVLDFGIAKSAADDSLTASDEAIGSPGFIAPEQLARGADAARPGPPADVFALGAVLALAMTGRAPFGGDGAARVLYRTLHEDPDLDGVPADLDGVPSPGPRAFLARCLARDPGERPTVVEVLAWCGERTAGVPWWERGAVAELIRRHEDDVARLLAPSAPPGGTGGTGASDSTCALHTSGALATSGALDASGASADSDSTAALGASGSTDTSAAPDAPTSPAALTAPTVPTVSDTPAPPRRRLLLWGGGALAAAAVATTATVAALAGNDGDGRKGKGSGGRTRWTRGRVLWTREADDVRTGGLVRRGADLYLLTVDGLTCLDAPSGTERWGYPEASLHQVERYRDTVYVLKDDLFEPEAHALGAATGRKEWQSPSHVLNPRRRTLAATDADNPLSTLEGDRGTLVLCGGVLCLLTYAAYDTRWARRSAQGRRWRAYGFDARTHRDLWYHQGDASGVVGTHQAGGRIAVATSARPAYGSEEPRGPLVVLRAADGGVERTVPGGAARPQAHPGARGTGVYAAGPGLTAVDLGTGRTRWSRRATAVTAHTPRPVRGLVLAAAGDGVSAYDAGSGGGPRWTRAGVRGLTAGDGSLLTADGYAYVLGPEPGTRGEPTWGLHALDVRTGATAWAVELGAGTTVAAAAAGDGLVHLYADDALRTVGGPDRS